ncbi:MAG: SGNH/GDSL hydrolase family protein [Ancrocorticia sp.]|uniref:SGNH/GDSL hydrolase family protein n=1 Tax=Ancrocorticia sp. TaxID=2593684 RepID=UPI003F8E38D5
MNRTARGITGLGIGAGTLTIYRRAKAVAKQNTPFRRRWEEHLLTTVEDLNRRAELPLIYVALGDSAAQGLGATRFEDGYVPRVASGLQAATGREVALLNLSLSGGTAASVLGTQIPQLEGLRIGGEPITPDVVTLDIGGNDVGVESLGVGEFGRRMDAIMGHLHGPTFVANIPTFRPLKTELRASQLSAQINRAAADAGAGLIDLEGLSNTLSMWTYMNEYHAGDMFHPNTPWYHRWSQMFMDEICGQFELARIDMNTVPVWRG